MKSFVYIMLICVVIFSCAPASKEKAPDAETEKKTYSPYVGDYEPTPLPENYDKPLWDDTHLHTSYSTDAGMIGNTLGPEEAYKFARGEEVTAAHGLPVRLIRPLDFLVVADHAENLGTAPMIAESNPILLENKFGKSLHDLVKDGKGHDAFQKWVTTIAMNTDSINSPKMMRTAWDRELVLAEQYNDPGKFTALIGFEWTSVNTPKLPGNLHRVVIFRDDAEKAKTVLPFSSFDSYNPEDLWKYMDNYENPYSQLHTTEIYLTV